MRQYSMIFCSLYVDVISWMYGTKRVLDGHDGYLNRVMGMRWITNGFWRSSNGFLRSDDVSVGDLGSTGLMHVSNHVFVFSYFCLLSISAF